MGTDFVTNIDSGVVHRKVGANIMRNMTAALFLVSIDAQNRAPIKTGKLRSDVFRSVFSLGGLRDGRIYFGIFIFKRGYARVQHDGLTFNHPKGGEALYATKALWFNGKKVGQILGRGAIS